MPEKQIIIRIRRNIRFTKTINLNDANLLLFCSHQEPRWPEDHFERDKRQAEWDFSKEFFCAVPGKDLDTNTTPEL